MRRTGSIIEDIATEKYPLAIHGPTVRGHALSLEPIFPASTARKKTFSFKACTVVKSHGWAFLISTQKENLYGLMEHQPTFITGLNTNQTTLRTRTVCIRLASFKITTMNGMILTVQTAIDLPVSKVSVKPLFISLTPGSFPWSLHYLRIGYFDLQLSKFYQYSLRIFFFCLFGPPITIR